jgi:sec-independent protein translocase protein TatC
MTKNKQTQQTKQPHKSQTKHNNTPSELTFLEHLRELRTRLFWVVLTLVLTSAVAFQIKDFLIQVVMAPLHGEKLVYLTPGGGFSFIFTLCIYFGALLSIPVAVYHLYRFLQPLLRRASHRFIAIFILLSALLATAGTVFGYYVAIPAALQFLTTFAGDTVTPNLTADSYLNFVVAYVLGLAAMFQIPLILFLVDHIRRIPPGGLASSQQYVVIGAAVAAAVITPTPDVLNMAIIAIPIVVVYEIGALAVFVRHSLEKRKHVVTISHQPVPVDMAEERRKRLELALQRMSGEPEAIAKPATAVVQQQQPAQFTPSVVSVPRRTMDGFAAGKRPMTMQSVMPKPDEKAARGSVLPTIPPTKRVRSLDGFSMAKA